jgi:hypothetical protein
MALGKLKKVDVREAWKHEAKDFTKWLSQEENLRLLGNEIGYDIVLIKTEAECGDFSVDILAEDEGTSKKIIIENQLEITNHDHLGKLITYASGHVASIAIWVVTNVREEHRKAIDWLNDHTDDDVEFYLVQMELLQIDESPYAPHFEIICKPNDWARSVKESTSQGAMSGIGADQFEFWTQFKAYAIQNRTALRLQKPSPRHWTNIGIGNSQAGISLTVNSNKGLIAAELYIPDNKELYAKLLAHKSEIETDLGSPAEWMELPSKKASRIKVSTSGDFNAKEKWNDYFKWLLTEAEKFYRTFPKYLS